MIDPFLILTPALLLVLVGLLRFVGCSFTPGVVPPPPPAAPLFDPIGGTFEGLTTVLIGDSDQQASIFYTLDGTTPGTAVAGSTLLFDLGNPIKISSQTTINAIAVDQYGGQSEMATATYLFPQPIMFQQFQDGFMPAGAAASAVTTVFNNPNKPVGAGSLMVLWIWYANGSQTVQVDSVIDSDMNMNYTRAVGPTGGTTVPGYQQEIWYGIVAVGGANFSVTANFSAAFSGDMDITGHEFTRAGQPAPQLQAASDGTGATSNATVGPVPATASGLVFAAATYRAGTAEPGNGFTQMSGVTGNISEFQAASVTGAYTASFGNGAVGWIAQVTTFE